MEGYEIRGLYPDGHRFRAFVDVEDQRDAVAIAQGLRKVTTINVIAVYAREDGRLVYYDKLRVNWK